MECIPQQWRQTMTWGSQPSGPFPAMARGSGRLRGSCSVLSIALWSRSNPDVFVEFSEHRRSRKSDHTANRAAVVAQSQTYMYA
jgi:hypothetical protein